MFSSSLRNTSPATHGAGQDYSALFKSQTHVICYTLRRTRLQCSLQVLGIPHLLHMEQEKITVLSSSLRHTSLATHGKGQDYSVLFKSQTHLICLHMAKDKITVLSSSLWYTSPATHGAGQDYSALFKSQTHLTCYTWRRKRLQCSHQVLDTPHLLHMEKDKITVLSSSLRHTLFATHGEGQDYSALFKSQAYLTCYTWSRTRLQCSLQVLDTPHLLPMEKEKITLLSSSLRHTSSCYTWSRTRLQCSLQVLDTPHLLHMEKEKITVFSSSLKHTSFATHGEGQDYSALFKSQTHLICYTQRRTKLQCSLQVLGIPHLVHMEKDKITMLSSSLRHTSLATHGEGKDYSTLFKSQAHLTCYPWRRTRLQCSHQVLNIPHLLHMEKDKITVLSSNLRHTLFATHGEEKDHSALFKSLTHLTSYTWRRKRLQYSLQVLDKHHLTIAILITGR